MSDSTWMVVLGLLAALGVMWGWLFWRRGAGTWLSPRERATIVALRALAFIALALFVLNPGCTEVSPDPEEYFVGVFIDHSGSFDVRDGRAPSRAERVAAATAVGADWRSDWESAHRLRFFHFNQDLRAGLPGGAPTGRTAIGDILATWPDTLTGAQRPAAILLITDGQVTTGRPLLEPLRNADGGGVPISFLGLGQPGTAPDFRVELEDGPRTFSPEASVEATARLANGLDEEREVEALLRIDGEMLARQRRTVGPGEVVNVAFAVEGVSPGPHLLSVSLAEVPEGDANPRNNAASALIDVRPPRQFTTIYIADEVSPEFRPLKLALEERSDLTLQSALDFGGGQLWADGVELPEGVGTLADYLAQGEAWRDADALIVPASTLVRLPPRARAELRGFVDQRGGGLLVQGLAPPPEDFAELLPARSPELRRDLRGQTLALRQEPLFNPADHAPLFEPPGLRIPETTAVATWAEPALGARAMLVAADAEAPLLWVHRFGGGRVALLGVEHTGPWRYRSALGLRQHRAFWSGLLGWLAEGGRERLEVAPAVAKVPLGQPVSLEAHVLDADYAPAADARVSASVTTGDGARAGSVELLPRPDEPGSFEGQWTPPESGLYLADVRAELPSGEVLRATSYLQAEVDQVELAQTHLEERLLRDAARLAGGRYASWESPFAPDELPLSADVPQRRSTTEWTRNGFWLSLIFLLFAAEWGYRRQKGLL